MYITTEYLETKFREPSLLVYSGKGTLFIRSSNLLNNENNNKKKKPSILTNLFYGRNVFRDKNTSNHKLRLRATKKDYRVGSFSLKSSFGGQSCNQTSMDKKYARIKVFMRGDGVSALLTGPRTK